MEIERVKYPKIPHLPWSRSIQDDDIIQMSLENIKSCPDIIVSEKMDGECSSLYRNGIHARSMDSKDHPSRHYVKKLQGEKLYNMPENMRFVGENMFAKHSIFYEQLPDYLLIFAMFMDDICLSWDATVAQATAYGFQTVPILYRGPYDEDIIKACFTGVSKCGGEQEGYVIRNAGGFYIDEFNQNILKFVRQHHVQTTEHWLNQPLIPNKLKQ